MISPVLNTPTQASRNPIEKVAPKKWRFERFATIFERQANTNKAESLARSSPLSVHLSVSVPSTLGKYQEGGSFASLSEAVQRGKDARRFSAAVCPLCEREEMGSTKTIAEMRDIICHEMRNLYDRPEGEEDVREILNLERATELECERRETDARTIIRGERNLLLLCAKPLAKPQTSINTCTAIGMQELSVP